MAKHGSEIQRLVGACPPHWQSYLSQCANTAVAVLRGFAIRGAPAGVDCPHHEFACFVQEHVARDRCQQTCLVGVTFALLSLFVDTLQGGKVDEGSVLLTSLQHLRVMLPGECMGDTFQDGCEPLLPTGWFASASGLLHEVTDSLAKAELRPAAGSRQRRAAGRSIAVVTAYHHAAKIWKWGDASKGNGTLADGIPMPWYFKNKQCYAARHGYNFVFRRRAPDIDLDTELDGYRYSIHWIKLAAVRQALRSYDWVFWIDYDALVGNMTQTLDEFIDIAERHAAVDLIVQDGPQLICPNAFLIRASRWSFQFLDDWERFGRMAVYGRSKMWELRCFNCALVDNILTATTGSSLRNCGELPTHLHLLRHMLEESGFGWYSRVKNPAVGKIYFWNAANRWPRGFLFNVNDGEQQRFFSQPDLYHPGDLAVHWPGPNKDNDVMRGFANELHEEDGCERWGYPQVAHAGAYSPIGAADAPGLFAPKHVLGAFIGRFHSAEAAVRASGGERTEVLELLIKELSGKQIMFDVPLGGVTSEEEKRIAFAQNNIRLFDSASMAGLPTTPIYDFIFVGSRPASLPNCSLLPPGQEAAGAPCPRTAQEELLQEVSEGLARLRPGGALVVPTAGCNSPLLGRVGADWEERLKDVTVAGAFVIWRSTRDVSKQATGPGTTATGCVWAYAQKLLQDDVYRRRAEAKSAQQRAQR